MTDILIIEDNATVRQLIKSEVRDLADGFHEGSDGAEALALYRRHKPDWVLMDLEMKQTDGLTATRQIIAAFPQARVCIVTNYDDDFLREEARRARARLRCESRFVSAARNTDRAERALKALSPAKSFLD